MHNFSSLIVGGIFLYCELFLIIKLSSEFNDNNPDYVKVAILSMLLAGIPLFLITGIAIVAS